MSRSEAATDEHGDADRWGDLLLFTVYYLNAGLNYRLFSSSYSLVNLQAYRGDIMLVRTLYFFFLRFRHLRAKLSKLKIGPQRPSY